MKKTNLLQPLSAPTKTALLLGLALGMGCGGGGGGGGTPSSKLSITAANGPEGSGGGTTDLEFVVTLDPARTNDVSVDYATSDLTAQASGDYVSSSGTLIFVAGETQKSILIAIDADDQAEFDETLTVSLTNPTGKAVLDQDAALGTIENDDLPRLSIGSADVTEGNAGTSTLDFTVTLEVPTGEVMVDYEVLDGSATEGSDYTGFAGTRTLTLAAGTLAQGISIEVQGDGDPELDETFSIMLSNLVGDAVFGDTLGTGTILDDDTAPASEESRITVSAETTFEGDAGDTTDVVFTALVDPPSATLIHLDYATLDDTATQPGDYTSTSGRLTLAAGSSGGSFMIPVLGDDDVEDLESFLVQLTLVFGDTSLGTPQARGYILDDDSAPGVPIARLGNPVAFEGDSGNTDLLFDVTLSEPATDLIQLDYTTSDDTALGGSDYLSRSDTLTIPPGGVLGTIRIPVVGDTVIEGDERFQVTLSNPSGTVTLGAAIGIATILTDDPLAMVSVENAGAHEGNSGDTVELVFTVEVFPAVTEPVDVTFQTVDATATAGVDYTSLAGTLTIQPGSLDTTLSIPILSDDDPENDEVLFLALTGTSPNAALADAGANGTIVNDDGDGGWIGAEMAHDGSVGGRRAALRPFLTLGTGGELNVAFNQEAFSGWELLIRSSPAPGVWNSPTLIGPSHAFALPEIGIDSSGEAVAVWENESVFANHTTSSTWEMAAALAPGEVIGAIDMAMDPATGEAFVVWTESLFTSTDGKNNIKYGRHVPGMGWVETGLVETGDGATGGPQIAMDAAGNVLVVFLQSPMVIGSTDIVSYRYSAGTWVGPVVLDTGSRSVGYPRIDMDAAGNAAVVWQQATSSSLVSYSIFVNRYDASTMQWSGPYEADEQTLFLCDDPDVAIDAAGNVFAIWLQDNPASEDLLANRYDAATDTWSGPQLLEFDDTVRYGPIRSPQIVADDAGNAFAVWNQTDGTLYNIRAARYSIANTAWGVAEPVEELDTGDANGPHLIIDRSTGDAAVAWHHARPDPVFGMLIPIVDIWVNGYDAQ